MNRLSKHSAYMEWAKLCSAAPFNLATSGLTNTSTAEFPLPGADMEITGPGGYGFAPLQERLARHTGAPAESVVAAAGASMANFLAMSVALNPGDEVIIESPAYGLFNDIASYLGVRITELPRPFDSGFAVDPDLLAGAITPQTRLIVLSNLHNPSGALLPAEVLSGIGELAQKAGVYVLVDEVYLEMMFDASMLSAFALGQQQFPDANPFIVTNSLTKAYGLSGLRCGWVLAAAPLSHRMWRLNDLFGVNAAHVAEQMSVVAFDRLEVVRTKARQLLITNRQLLNDFLDAHPELPCYRPSFGTVAFPRLLAGSPDEFFKLLRDKYETSVVPGAFFGMPDHFRIGVGGSTEVVREGLERLGSALRDFGRPG
ncbi:MAG: pyridoxal phosphate-dependent aminotransferase [Chthoniobacterales bacterium]